MGYLQEARKGFFSFLVTDDQDTASAAPGEAAKRADVFLVVNATSADLPALEQYAAEAAAQKPLILWNLELDTLRSDLGELLDAGCLQAAGCSAAGRQHLYDCCTGAMQTRVLVLGSAGLCSTAQPLGHVVCRLARLPRQGRAVPLPEHLQAHILCAAARLLQGALIAACCNRGALPASVSAVLHCSSQN